MNATQIERHRKTIQKARVDSLRLGLINQSEAVFKAVSIAADALDEIESLREQLADANALIAKAALEAK